MTYLVYYRAKWHNPLTEELLLDKTGSMYLDGHKTPEAALDEARFIIEAEADEVEVSLNPIKVTA